MTEQDLRPSTSLNASPGSAPIETETPAAKASGLSTTDAQARHWRSATAAVRASHLRRRFPSTVNVGDPDGEFRHVAARDAVDFGERIEVITSLVDALGAATWPVLVWLARPGELTAHDEDMAWQAAVRHAAAELGRDLRFAVVTRQGWYDPTSMRRGAWRTPARRG